MGQKEKAIVLLFATGTIGLLGRLTIKNNHELIVLNCLKDTVMFICPFIVQRIRPQSGLLKHIQMPVKPLDPCGKISIRRTLAQRMKLYSNKCPVCPVELFVY